MLHFFSCWLNKNLLQLFFIYMELQRIFTLAAEAEYQDVYSPCGQKWKRKTILFFLSSIIIKNLVFLYPEKEQLQRRITKMKERIFPQDYINHILHLLSFTYHISSSHHLVVHIDIHVHSSCSWLQSIVGL